MFPAANSPAVAAGDNSAAAGLATDQRGAPRIPPGGTVDIGAVQTSVVARSQLVATGADAGGGPNVVLFDALTHNFVQSFFAYDPKFTGGVRIAVGDVNGDGFADIITAPGPGGGPDIHVYDGATGQFLRQFFAYDMNFTGGVHVAAGDVNGDGFADIICGADAGGGPNVTVFSGQDGSRLVSFFPYDPAFTGGVTVAVADMDGDGKVEVVTGAGPGGGPHVKVFGGPALAPQYSFAAFDPAFTGGVFVG